MTTVPSQQPETKPRIAVFLDGDRTWSLPGWASALPRLKENYDVVGLWKFDQKFGKLKNNQIPKWYFQIFGLKAFVLLATHAVLTEIRNLISGHPTFRRLADRNGVSYFEGTNPNNQAVVDWVQATNVDIIILMVGHIIKQPLIDATRLGIINKHAACLPSCKGMFPYFWAKLFDEPLGVSFHIVNARIDEGPILVQRRYLPRYPSERHSMLRFYKDVFASYPALLLKAAERLVGGQREPHSYDGQATYYSFPERIDAIAFRGKGHAVARVSDIFYRGQPSHFQEANATSSNQH